MRRCSASSASRCPSDVTAPEPGVTRLWMAVDGAAAAYFDARDALRPDAAEAVAALRGAGLRVLMLTGDSAAAAAPIAQQAGITEVEAGLDPAGKLARIRALQQVRAARGHGGRRHQRRGGAGHGRRGHRHGQRGGSGAGGGRRAAVARAAGWPFPRRLSWRGKRCA